MHPRLDSRPFTLILLISILAGCGSDRLPTHAVEGKLKFEDGTHPMFGNIEFYSSEHQVNARGKIDRDGTFTVKTYEDSEGAVAGEHKVVIIQIAGNYLTEKLSDQIKLDHGELINARYFDYRSSDLECIISPGKNSIELVVQKATKASAEAEP